MFDHGSQLQLDGQPAGSAPELAGAGPDPHGREDEDLMRQVARGDVGAFTRIVERYSSRLYRVAYRMLNSAAEAEDAVQHGFSKLWQTAAGWQARGGGLAAWLHRVIVNFCLDRLRQFRLVSSEMIPELADDAPGPERVLECQGLALAVQDALGSLPGRHRAAIVLCYFEGLSNRVAAQVLEINLKSMESLLFRARRNLRELLEQRGVGCEDLELLP